jgi:hypothetical protein
MKTERRHQLEHNQLADALGEQLGQVRPYFKTILAVVIAAAAVVVAVAVISSRRSAAMERAWTDFYAATATSDAEKIEAFADKHPGTHAALWALLNAGELRMQQGSSAMFTDRKQAEAELDRAKRDLETVVKGAGNNEGLRRRAQLGLASTFEAQNLPEDAEPIYEALVKAEPEGPFGKLAAQRLEQLRRLSSEKWYAWFDKQRPTPAADPLNFNDLNKLPDANDLTPGGTSDILPKILDDRLKIPGVTPDDSAVPGPTTPDTTTPAPTVRGENVTPDPNKPANPPADPTTPGEVKPETPPATETPPAGNGAKAPKTDNAPPADPQPE